MSTNSGRGRTSCSIMRAILHPFGRPNYSGRWAGAFARDSRCEGRSIVQNDPVLESLSTGSLGALQRSQNLRERRVGDRLDLRRGAVLDRMRDVDDGRLEAQRIALRGDAVDELGGDDVDAREAAVIEIVEVVQTARCAGPSIA